MEANNWNHNECSDSRRLGVQTDGANAEDSATGQRGKFHPQQGDLRLSGPPSGQDAGGGARTRDRRVPADLRADSLATVPPTPQRRGHGKRKTDSDLREGAWREENKLWS
ncbi:hypothetical protein PoB_005715000 [Plakobranchus ocellatus]|uniref:Uncharacterized protein n=1 Tax=Plakobranchus ocellatus TaxID=259542 RepID=A0AAV4CGK1_9GAST|nr:hypothetical protein PoB_005715000 [Plakobranchus ocellatus]